MNAAWIQTLEECEARLDAAEAALDSGAHPDVAAFSPADGPDEPFPPALVDRTLALVKRGVELERRLALNRDEVVSELRRLPRARVRRHRAESHFELKA